MKMGQKKLHTENLLGGLAEFFYMPFFIGQFFHWPFLLGNLLGSFAEVDSEGKTVALHSTGCVHCVTKQAVPSIAF